MKKILFLSLFTCISLLCLAGCSGTSDQSASETKSKKIAEANASLNQLYNNVAGAKALGAKAKGVLIFPEITKAGLLIGGQYGNGVLFKNGQPAGFYNSTAASYGLQAGVQTFGYAMFFMGDKDLDYLAKSEGWEIGVGPTLTVVDQGVANSITTTTAREGVFVFFFEQKGLMAGLGIQGTKVSRVDNP